jgi:hypothetical protein
VGVIELSKHGAHACMLCGSRCLTAELLDEHLEKVHQTTRDELRHVAPTTTGPQGPGARRG